MIDVSTRITSWGARVVTVKGHHSTVEVSWHGTPDAQVLEAAYNAALEISQRDDGKNS